MGPHTLDLAEAVLALLAQLGLRDADAARAFHVLVRSITGLVALEESIGARGLDADLWQREMRGAYGSVSEQRYPHVVALAGELAHTDFDDQFEFGIELLLDGLARRARRR